MYMTVYAYMFTYPFSNVIENHHLAIPSFRRVCRLFKSFPDSQPVDENALAIAFDKAPSLRRQMRKSTVDCWINRASPNDLSCGKNNNQPSSQIAIGGAIAFLRSRFGRSHDEPSSAKRHGKSGNSTSWLVVKCPKDASILDPKMSPFSPQFPG